jgi:hypothetical protein
VDQLANFLPAGEIHLEGLGLAKIRGLRRLALRTALCRVFVLELDVLIGVLSTISSPTFCEFVLELILFPAHFDETSSENWGRWEKVDEFLHGRFAQRGDFKVIIRTGEIHDWETFQRHMKEGFPLSARRGCIHFETSRSLEK